MTKNFGLLTAAIFFSLLFTGCIKDTCQRTYHYTYYIPVYKTQEEVRVNIKSNPPKTIQSPGKIFVLGNYIFLNEIDKGVHIIDNSNPASPQNVAFIDIPGNMDLAVKDKTLYADAYTDLVTIDITNPLNVVVKKYNNGVFPYRSYGNGFIADNQKIIIDWIERDTAITENCVSGNVIMQDIPGIYLASFSSESNSSAAKVSPVGQGGSMARFALLNNYLYTVGDNELSAFNITNSADPVFSNKFVVDWHVETIYPFRNQLFVGSNNGMFIYNTENSPGNPVKTGEFTHARACDPVIADDTYAYVTLHSETDCLGYNNELDVVQLKDLVNATLVKTYSFTSPHGLSKDGDLLFICDGGAGLKVYNASDPLNLQLIKECPGPETYDVIAINKIALVVAKDGLYQYDYSDLNKIHLISKTNISSK